jgi:hypothetical protein
MCIVCVYVCMCVCVFFEIKKTEEFFTKLSEFLFYI